MVSLVAAAHRVAVPAGVAVTGFPNPLTPVVATALPITQATPEPATQVPVRPECIADPTVTVLMLPPVTPVQVRPAVKLKKPPVVPVVASVSAGSTMPVVVKDLGRVVQVGLIIPARPVCTAVPVVTASTAEAVTRVVVVPLVNIWVLAVTAFPAPPAVRGTPVREVADLVPAGCIWVQAVTVSRAIAAVDRAVPARAALITPHPPATDPVAVANTGTAVVV